MRQDNDHAHISTSFWVFSHSLGLPACLCVPAQFFLSHILLFIISVYLGFCAQILFFFLRLSRRRDRRCRSQLNAYSRVIIMSHIAHVFLNTILLLNVCQGIWLSSLWAFWSLHKRTHEITICQEETHSQIHSNWPMDPARIRLNIEKLCDRANSRFNEHRRVCACFCSVGVSISKQLLFVTNTNSLNSIHFVSKSIGKCQNFRITENPSFCCCQTVLVSNFSTWN